MLGTVAGGARRPGLPRLGTVAGWAGAPRLPRLGTVTAVAEHRRSARCAARAGPCAWQVVGLSHLTPSSTRPNTRTRLRRSTRDASESRLDVSHGVARRARVPAGVQHRSARCLLRPVVRWTDAPLCRRVTRVRSISRLDATALRVRGARALPPPATSIVFDARWQSVQGTCPTLTIPIDGTGQNRPGPVTVRHVLRALGALQVADFTVHVNWSNRCTTGAHGTGALG
jgi:hypothetical protein